ncbi:MAG: hypothetical protein OXF02_02400 [Simkaniaceae bacterium]|nr:hypothetical protein [Simkaniaceae bacterium]
MTKEGIAHTVTKNIIIPMENIDPTPVVTNQPVVAPEGADQQNFGDVVLAPAIAVNNVARGRWRGCQKWAITSEALIGETLGGAGCAVGAIFGATEIATRMGATVAVIDGATAGAGILVCLCTFGGAMVTVGRYPATKHG